MTEALEPLEEAPLLVHTAPVIQMDDEQFFQFCQINRDLRIERTAEGDLVIMAPAGGSSGSANAKLTQIFGQWAEADGTGRIFDSDTGFRLPNGAVRAPDVAWVLNERLSRLTEEQWEKFLPLCPDFALELRSPSDSLATLKAKMEEYLANGARLGWLIDPKRKSVHVYRPGKPVEILDDPQSLDGEDVLPGFTLELSRVWSVMQIPGR